MDASELQIGLALEPESWALTLRASSDVIGEVEPAPVALPFTSTRYYGLGFRLSRTGPWQSYPLTPVGAQTPAPPRLSGPLAKRRFAPCEVFRDLLESAGQDGAAQALAAPEMVYLPGGTFQMGDEQGGSDERPVHPVRVPASAMGRTRSPGATTCDFARRPTATGRNGWKRTVSTT